MMRRFLGFAFALRAAFCIAALMQAAESKDALFLVLEMSLITAGVLLASWPFRIALMPAVFMKALQLSSLCMTGFYTDPNTIQNIGLTETVGGAAYRHRRPISSGIPSLPRQLRGNGIAPKAIGSSALKTAARCVVPMIPGFNGSSDSFIPSPDRD